MILDQKDILHKLFPLGTDKVPLELIFYINSAQNVYGMVNLEP